MSKWEAKQVSYQIKNGSKQDIRKNISGLSTKIINTAKTVYRVMFSDLDGDNCPFYPSCSQFYVDAVNETNILKGTLMFVDRFTRDINFFKGFNSYPRYSNNKFYDPAVNYTLIQKNVIFKPIDLPAK
jgi:putative component of membrane protein insertase Oxa1/YidC/SpoIIIJ protein YidD